MPNEHFIRNNFVLLAATTMASAIHYLFQFSMGRLLGPADYGILAALFSIIYITIAPVQAVQLTLTKFVAELKAQGKLAAIKGLLMRSLQKIFIISVAIFLAFALLSRQISNFLNIEKAEIILAFSFIFLGLFVTAATRGFFQGLQKFRALGANLILESLVKVTLGFALVINGLGIVGAILGVNIAVFTAFGLAAALLFKMFNKHATSNLDNKQKSAIYTYSFPMLIALSTVTALYSIDVILVKHFFLPAEAGIYAAAALVAKVIFFALMPISQVMFPKIAELKAKQQDFNKVFLKSAAIVAALSATAVAIYFTEPKYILTFLFGSEYNAAIPLIGLFGAAISLLSVSYVFVNYFLSSGRTTFVYVLPIFAIAEALLIWLWHNSLYQVIANVTALMAILLATLTLFYILSKKPALNFIQ